MNTLDGQRIAVVGLGKSGLASLEALRALTGATVSAWDADMTKLAGAVPFRPDAAGSDQSPEELAYKVLAWRPDIVIPAPAIPEVGPFFHVLEAAHVPLWSEIELAWHLRKRDEHGHAAPWLAVTGTNGKTTTVGLVGSMLAAAGMGGTPLGNIGNPAVSVISTSDDAAFVLELSSFQLRTTHSMEPWASVVLNVDVDHLEWHGSLDAYRAAKARIYERTRSAAIYPVGDATVQAMVDGADVREGARAIGFTHTVPEVGEVGVVDGLIVDRAFGRDRWNEALPIISLDELGNLSTDGGAVAPHMISDVLAAVSLARSLDIAPEHVRAGILGYHPNAHRIQLVDTIDGVRYIDDSKATNVLAAHASVMAQKPGTVVWIVGGLPKGAEFGDLVREVRQKLRGVVVIGRDQQPWHAALDDESVPTVFVSPDSADPMGEAVTAAASMAEAGDTVLLAPASASMDQFASYAARGDRFVAAVERLR